MTSSISIPRTRTVTYTADTEITDVPLAPNDDVRKTIAIPKVSMRTLVYGFDDDQTAVVDVSQLVAAERAVAAAIALTVSEAPAWNRHLIRAVRKAVRAKSGEGVLLRVRGSK